MPATAVTGQGTTGRPTTVEVLPGHVHVRLLVVDRSQVGLAHLSPEVARQVAAALLAGADDVDRRRGS
jgi:hypothetical protein